MALGRFDYIEVELFNQETGEQKRFHCTDWEEVNKAQDIYYSLLDDHSEEHNEYWKIFKYNFVTCDCGKKVACTSFTNTCSCGADYSMDGSQLAPRSQWGEETGETLTDIFNGSYDDDYDEFY
jgi:hypothetical protein